MAAADTSYAATAARAACKAAPAAIIAVAAAADPTVLADGDLFAFAATTASSFISTSSASVLPFVALRPETGGQVIGSAVVFLILVLLESGQSLP